MNYSLLGTNLTGLDKKNDSDMTNYEVLVQRRKAEALEIGLPDNVYTLSGVIKHMKNTVSKKLDDSKN